jgi:hypothetical protein
MKKPSSTSQSLTTSSAAAIGLAIAACSVFFLLYVAPPQTDTAVFTELQLLSMQLGTVEQRNHDRMVQLGAAERRNHGMLVNMDQRLTDIRTALNVLAEAMDVTPTLKKGAQAEDVADEDLSSESKAGGVGGEEAV